MNKQNGQNKNKAKTNACGTKNCKNSMKNRSNDKE